MDKYKVILNPTSGSGRGARSMSQLKSLLEYFNLSYDLVKTDAPWHAAHLAKEAALSGYEVIVSVGGDGTANEVLNGIMEAQGEAEANPAMGILTVGRGNDYAYSLGIPLELEPAVQVLAENHRRVVDVGRVYGGKSPDGRYFGNCVGVGFDAIGTIEASKLPRLGGFLSYLIAVLRTIFLYYQAPLIQVDYDEQSLTQPCLLVSVMNGRRLGGGFRMAPEASFEDGIFDLCIASQMSRPRMFQLLPHFMKGTQATQPEIKTAMGSRITITALEGVLPAQVDGEILCTDGDHLEIEMLPQRLQVLCPAQGN